jgi:hypothetical protein
MECFASVLDVETDRVDQAIGARNRSLYGALVMCIGVPRSAPAAMAARRRLRSAFAVNSVITGSFGPPCIRRNLAGCGGGRTHDIARRWSALSERWAVARCTNGVAEASEWQMACGLTTATSCDVANAASRRPFRQCRVSRKCRLPFRRILASVQLLRGAARVVGHRQKMPPTFQGRDGSRGRHPQRGLWSLS